MTGYIQCIKSQESESENGGTREKIEPTLLKTAENEAETLDIDNISFTPCTNWRKFATLQGNKEFCN
jgi:hypothetical protein